MPDKKLFQDVLAAVDPATVLRTEAQPQLLRRGKFITGEAGAVAKPPSNEEILKAARAQYGQQSTVVDANTLNGQAYVKTSPGHVNVAQLNAYDWKSQQSGPIAPTSASVASSSIIQPGLQQARASGQVATTVIGISESAQFIVGEEGGIGIAFDSNGAVNGTGYVAGKLGLDIDVAINLQLGLWASDTKGLAGDFVGLEVNLDLDVGVCLGIYMHPKDLSFYGFSIGIGVGVGGGVTIVGGYTWVF